jgi:uncharacterized lipoprotein YajG
MKQSLRTLVLLAAICLMTSCAAFKTSQKAPDEVFICPSNAFIDTKDYAITGPKDRADFKRYAADMAKKYPVLKDAYGLLYDCWTHYHPDQGVK